MAEYMPDDYTPPVRTGGNGASAEWQTAGEFARARPGTWVKVNPPRAMKPPTGWCSEVRLNQKSGQQTHESWEAAYEKIDRSEVDGTPLEVPLYVKLVRLVAPVAAPHGSQ